jgi:hypothetical protein
MKQLLVGLSCASALMIGSQAKAQIQQLPMTAPKAAPAAPGVAPVLNAPGTSGTVVPGSPKAGASQKAFKDTKMQNTSTGVNQVRGAQLDFSKGQTATGANADMNRLAQQRNAVNAAKVQAGTQEKPGQCELVTSYGGENGSRAVSVATAVRMKVLKGTVCGQIGTKTVAASNLGQIAEPTAVFLQSKSRLATDANRDGILEVSEFPKAVRVEARGFMNEQAQDVLRLSGREEGKARMDQVCGSACGSAVIADGLCQI